MGLVMIRVRDMGSVIFVVNARVIVRGNVIVRVRVSVRVHSHKQMNTLNKINYDNNISLLRARTKYVACIERNKNEKQ